MIKILETNIKNFKPFTHVVHVGDVHIRINKRHDEYKEVFDRFYNTIKTTPETTVIVVAGDIFHSKIDLSPECVQMASDLFNNLADLRPTVLIAGNHDATLSNKNRLDCLTPIIEAIDHSNLHYLKNSGLYAIGNILFNNMGVFEPVGSYIKGKDIPDIYRNKYTHYIGLYHGPVDGCVNEMGYSFINKEITCDFFDGHHIVMLGDIHKEQTLQKFQYDNGVMKPTIRFCGSMIQQNHGESSTGHGFTLWDLKSLSYNHVELKNDFGYFTIDVNKGNLETDLSSLPKKPRLRVRCLESVVSEVKDAMLKIYSLSDVQEVVYERVPINENETNLIISGKDIDLSNVSQLDQQDSLLTKYLKEKLKVDDEEKIKSVISLNKLFNDSISGELPLNSIRWKPKKFEWSNMFSYGEDNVIDFSKLDGLYGVFAPNKSGKSSIMSALSFCIFDKCDRTSMASEVLNVHKSSFKCKFNFEIDGVDFFIERIGTSDRKGNVKVETNFWKIQDGKKIDLNGGKRSDTNEEIRKYLGTYDDFVLTALSVQNVKNAASFIDIGDSARKDILTQFLGIGIFDRLHEKAMEKLKELDAFSKSVNKEGESVRYVELSKVLSQLEEIYKEHTNRKLTISENISTVNESVIQLTSKLIKIDDTVGNWTEDQIKKSIESLESLVVKSTSECDKQVKSLLELLPGITSAIELKNKELIDVDNQISEIEGKKISDTYNLYQTAIVEYNKIKSESDRLVITLNSYEDKLAHLSKHQFDPDCKFCVKNAAATGEEAVKTKKLLEDGRVRLKSLQETIVAIKKSVDEYEWVIKDQQKYTDLLSLRNRIKDNISLNKNKVVECEKKITSFKHQLESDQNKFNKDILMWNDRLQKFLANKEAIQSNFDVQVQISSMKSKQKELQQSLNNTDNIISETNKKIGMAKSQLDQIEKMIERVKSTEKSLEAHQLYCKCVCRDGIPYELVCGAVPEIEREVNVILNQIDQFHAKFETDGKNIIPYLSVGDSKWNMKLSSGFERFALGIAIRVALTNLSNLPRPTFIMIDEGFGTADTDGLSMMPSLFTLLKTNFKFILIISHLDSMKDMVDGVIEIKKDSEFSVVNFS